MIILFFLFTSISNSHFIPFILSIILYYSNKTSANLSTTFIKIYDEKNSTQFSSFISYFLQNRILEKILYSKILILSLFYIFYFFMQNMYSIIISKIFLYNSYSKCFRKNEYFSLCNKHIKYISSVKITNVYLKIQ